MRAAPEEAMCPQGRFAGGYGQVRAAAGERGTPALGLGGFERLRRRRLGRGHAGPPLLEACVEDAAIGGGHRSHAARHNLAHNGRPRRQYAEADCADAVRCGGQRAQPPPVPQLPLAKSGAAPQSRPRAAQRRVQLRPLARGASPAAGAPHPRGAPPRRVRSRDVILRARHHYSTARQAPERAHCPRGVRSAPPTQPCASTATRLRPARHRGRRRGRVRSGAGGEKAGPPATRGR
eukprot:scaffold8813_cov96-Isochrysis_galbana.AAC.3